MNDLAKSKLSAMNNPANNFLTKDIRYAFVGRIISFNKGFFVALAKKDLDMSLRTDTQPITIGDEEWGTTETTYNDDGTVDISYYDNEGNQMGSMHCDTSEEAISCTATDSYGTEAEMEVSVTETDEGAVTIEASFDVEGGWSSSGSMSSNDVSGETSTWDVEVVDADGTAHMGTITVDSETGKILDATGR